MAVDPRYEGALQALATELLKRAQFSRWGVICVAPPSEGRERGRRRQSRCSQEQ